MARKVNPQNILLFLFVLFVVERWFELFVDDWQKILWLEKSTHKYISFLFALFVVEGWFELFVYLFT